MYDRLLFCCCRRRFASNDNTAERSLLKPSWFHKVARSNPRPQEEDSVKWWRQGWNSVRQTGEWCESLVEDYVEPKWKRFVRRCHAEGKVVYNSKPVRFHYDRVSYELNFDEECRDFNDGGNQGLSKVSDGDETKTAP